MGGIEGAQTMEKAFNKTYGLNLQFKFTPGPAMPQFASRIIQEAKAGQPSSSDLFVGSENHVARMSLKSVDWSKAFSHITAPMIDFDNRVLIVTTRTPGFTYNSKLVTGNDMPQRVEDVLNPKWKGKIASTPYAASFDRLSMIWGEEKTTAFLQKFVKQVSGLIRCGEDERIASGEFAMLVFNCDLAAPQEAKEKGGPVDGQVFRDAGILVLLVRYRADQRAQSQRGDPARGVSVEQGWTGYSLQNRAQQLASGEGHADEPVCRRTGKAGSQVRFLFGFGSHEERRRT